MTEERLKEIERRDRYTSATEVADLCAELRQLRRVALEVANSLQFMAQDHPFAMMPHRQALRDAAARLRESAGKEE